MKYVKTNTANLYENDTSKTVKIELLWGDGVHLLGDLLPSNRYPAKARGVKGFVDAAALTDEALLELYFIDVGQGDGILMVTPDRKHVMIDGGYHRKAQPHGKSAADFVDWKFYVDYGQKKITLDAMVCSHCDADHYGGLWDLLNPEEVHELDVRGVEVKGFFHAGVGWWKSAAKDRFLGMEAGGYLHDLLEGRPSIEAALNDGPQMRLQGNWRSFMECLVQETPAITDIQRLGYHPGQPFRYLPGFENTAPVAIKVLGPIEDTVDGNTVLPDLGGASQNTNGNSLLLRVDYGRTRILLTGDLNKKSQHRILEAFQGNRLELAADVAKACHHGSDDCSFEFMECVQASAHIISSGDDETHAHPRPNIVATCGITGYKKIHNDELVTPLIFSTEISRSLRLGDPYQVAYKNYPMEGGMVDIKLDNEKAIDIGYTRTTSGGLRPAKKTAKMNRLKVVDGIVYGLVNVRTDGNKILCATLNEGKSTWEVQTFNSRF